MLNPDFLKELNQHAYDLGTGLGTLSQSSMKDVPLIVKTKASGIRLICKHIYSNTRKYLEWIDYHKQDEKQCYTEGDLIHDLLTCAYLFISICGTSYHYYEDVLLACEDICPDCMAWEWFHKLKADLERLYALAL